MWADVSILSWLWNLRCAHTFLLTYLLIMKITIFLNAKNGVFAHDYTHRFLNMMQRPIYSLYAILLLAIKKMWNVVKSKKDGQREQGWEKTSTGVSFSLSLFTLKRQLLKDDTFHTPSHTWNTAAHSLFMSAVSEWKGCCFEHPRAIPCSQSLS